MSTEEEETFAAETENETGGGDDGSGSRARNRTVMLTPEITGEVRARLAQDMAAPPAVPESIPGLRRAGQPAASESRSTPPSGNISGAIGMDAPSNVTAESSTPTDVSAPTPSYQGRPGVIYTKNAPVTGFLVSYDNDENGEIFELRMGRLIVTSEPPGTGNYFVIDDETVSSMHAILRVASYGEIQILDQLSEYGTKIQRGGDPKKEEDLSGDKSTLSHGDVVIFGERTFHLCLIAREEDE